METQPPVPPVAPQTSGVPASLCNQPFDRSKIIAPKTMLLAQLDNSKYESVVLPKAIAMTEDGFGWVQTESVAVPDDLVRQHAINGCSMISGGKLCTAIAVGNVFCPGGLGTAQAIKVPTNLIDEGPFENPGTPGTLTYRSTLQSYASFTGFKAYAFSLNGYGSFVFGPDRNPPSGWRGPRSQVEANRMAMEECEISAVWTPCTLYAEGNNIVFKPNAMNRSPVIDYTRTALAKPLLGFSNAQVDEVFRPAYFPGADISTFRGFIAKGYGAWGISTTSMAGAIGLCADPTCVAYSSGPNIVYKVSNVYGMKNQLVHCRAMPRTSCEDHKKMGCTVSGTYTIFEAGALKETTCNF